VLWQPPDRPVPGGRPRAVAMDSHPDEPPSRGAVDDEHEVVAGRRPSRQRVVVGEVLHRLAC
jgi:hypothetical protein